MGNDLEEIPISRPTGAAPVIECDLAGGSGSLPPRHMPSRPTAVEERG